MPQTGFTISVEISLKDDRWNYASKFKNLGHSTGKIVTVVTVSIVSQVLVVCRASLASNSIHTNKHLNPNDYVPSIEATISRPW